MHPVVVIARDYLGAAYEYSRREGTIETHLVRLDPVPVGTTLPALSAPDVELLRSRPDTFFKET